MNEIQRRALLCLVLFLVPFAASAQTRPNVLRNGSFEGGLLYWHNINPQYHKLVRGDALVGEFSLRVEKEFVMSAPFSVEAGKPFTVSFLVKADRDGEVVVPMAPTAREDAVNARRLWVAGADHKASVGTQWKRVSFTAKADVPPSGFWPNPHCLVQISGTVPIQVDGVSVNVGGDALPGRERKPAAPTATPSSPTAGPSGASTSSGPTTRSWPRITAR